MNWQIAFKFFFVFAFQAMLAGLNLADSKTHVVNSMQKVYFHNSSMQLQIIDYRELRITF